jgi:hypothetical protein
MDQARCRAEHEGGLLERQRVGDAQHEVLVHDDLVRVPRT